jgi:hypothetical protein
VKRGPISLCSAWLRRHATGATGALSEDEESVGGGSSRTASRRDRVGAI